MPPKKKKDNTSKKSEQKKKEKLVEDKTFGLKNKKKSKVVKDQIRAIEKNVMNSGDPKMRKLEEQRRQAKAAAKARKAAEKQERDALFGEALLAVQKKGSTNKKDGKVEAKGRDGGDDEKKSGTSRAMKMMFQMDAKEMEDKLKEDPNYVPTIEDEIETQRQKMFDDLKKRGVKGTPVTEKSFNEWLAKKRKRKEDEARKKLDAEMKKKKGGKGLAVLSGKELYTFNQDLFVEKDDDEIEEESTNNDDSNGDGMNDVAKKVESDLFLDGDDDDSLDDIEDD